MVCLGYTVKEVLYSGKLRSVYKAKRDRDNKPVILKCTPISSVDSEAFASAHREFELIKKLDHVPGIIHAYDLIEDAQNLTLVFEDINGSNLKSYAKGKPISTNITLDIAIQIANTLSEIHQHSIMHKDINPYNIIYCPEKNNARITDFKISSYLSEEHQAFQHASKLEGTLAYISPEQTGRLNRAIDYRTDFYSLGIMLYELLTGSVPFRSTENHEIIHSHIAKAPKKLSKYDLDIPVMLVRIIDRLMQKMANCRYQSAYGLKFDLEKVRDLLAEGKQYFLFTLGEKDISPNMIIPQKLYGRGKEISFLFEKFENVRSGSAEFVFISGYSGTGKSALIHELHKPLTELGGTFIEGKFDQNNWDNPFSALGQALESFVQYLLQEDKQVLAKWKIIILKSLGESAAVLQDLIPSLELIIGRQPKVSTLSGEMALNRFNHVLGNFIFSLATFEHPIVLFLDDWQWADPASLSLLRDLTKKDDKHFFMLLAAYRDNEVSEIHPFAESLKVVKKKLSNVSEIKIGNLGRLDVNAFIEDCFPKSIHQGNLATLVYEKTQGNAFFMIQFLTKLYKKGFVKFDYITSLWRWNIEDIQKQNVTNNIVQLMEERMLTLPLMTQDCLKYAACIGARFSLDEVAQLRSEDRSNTALALDIALQEKVIQPVGTNYRLAAYQYKGTKVEYCFIHDRVQQAAYNLLDKTLRNKTHYHIAHSMLDALNKEEQTNKIFEIVNHYNIGVSIINDSSERYTLCLLNLKAGRKAYHATAYNIALEYMQKAIAILPKGAWQTTYAETYACYYLAATLARLLKKHELMEELLEKSFIHAQNALDKAKLWNVRLLALTDQNKLSAAIDASLSALTLLDCPLIKTPDEATVCEAIAHTKKVLNGKKIESFINLPPIESESRALAIDIMGDSIAVAYWMTPNFLVTIIAKMTAWTAEHGYGSSAGLAFTLWGFIEGTLLEDIETGCQFGDLGVKIAEKNDLLVEKPLFMYAVAINQFKHHISTSFTFLERAYKISLDKGDHEYAPYILNNMMQFHFHNSRPLSLLCDEMSATHRSLELFENSSSLYWHDIYWQLSLNFAKNSEHPVHLKGIAYNECELLPVHLKAKDASTLFLAYSAKLMASVFFGDYQEAIENAKQTQANLTAGVGSYSFVLYFYYASLAVIGNAKQKASTSPEMIETIQENQKVLRKWANNSPSNHLHRWHLVEAESLNLQGDYKQALFHYHYAIENASKNNFLHDEALATELMARACSQMGLIKQKDTFLSRAILLYSNWGAQAKVKQLYDAYPELKINLIESKISNHHTSSIDHDSKNIDIDSLVRSYQAITKEIVSGDLSGTLLKIMMENAGADSGYLFQEKEGHFTVVIAGKVQQESDQITLLEKKPSDDEVPQQVLSYVIRKKEAVVIDDLHNTAQFCNDPYVQNKMTRSLFCEPILYQGNVRGIILLENSLTAGAFTKDRLVILKILSSQAAISLEQAILYTNLETQVKARTEALQASLMLQKQLNTDLDLAKQGLQKANTALFQLASRDGLTGIFNRRTFDERMRECWDITRRARQGIGMMMIDIDYFKLYNDHFGHQEGDDCIRTIASTLDQCCSRDSDILARYGGEEFSIIVLNSSQENLFSLAQKCKNTIEALRLPHPASVVSNYVTISIGVAYVIPEEKSKMTNAEMIAKFIGSADKNLYRAKKNGRNQTVG